MKAANFIARAVPMHQLESRTYLREQVQLRFNQGIALTLLCMFSPMLLLIMFFLWKADGAPILFGHYRVGKNGKVFKCWKFRSMRRDSETVLATLLKTDEGARDEWVRDQKLTNDPRITPIGNLLRKSSLDELPQLLNVLKGEMYLVGPRPVTVTELARYGETRWHYLSVAPGITGLWQISGRNNTTYEERVELDRQYVENRSFTGDFYILLKTVKVVVLREGAR